ncbi:MAG: hypothetical protein M3O91_10030 [Chloroflexota bacterium]|nr:hypothetical protein [Chloroflexota bacterium]
MHHQASFITDFFVKAKPGLKPATDFTFFPFPDIDSKNAISTALPLVVFFALQRYFVRGMTAGAVKG